MEVLGNAAELMVCIGCALPPIAAVCLVLYIIDKALAIKAQQLNAQRRRQAQTAKMYDELAKEQYIKRIAAERKLRLQKSGGTIIVKSCFNASADEVAKAIERK